MSKQPVKPAPRAAQQIIIVGNGLSAWMTAATLARVVNRDDFTITVIDDGACDNDAALLGTADACIPTPESLHAALALDEHQFVADGCASFTLGVALGGWSSPELTYFSPYSSIGASFGPVSFPQALMRLRQDGQQLKLANFALGALAAQAGRFDRPAPSTRSVLSTLAWGLHIDIDALTEYYRRSASALQVESGAAILRDVERADEARLRAVITADDTRHTADWFVDCTGSERRLLPDAGSRDWQSWADGPHCDRIVSTTTAGSAIPALFSYAAAHRAGWIRQLPLQNAVCSSAFFSSDFMDDDAAVAELQAAAGGAEASAGVRQVEFGQLGQAWRGNCIALGTAAAVLDPVGLSNLQLLRSSLNRLLQLLPAEPDATIEAVEFNRQTHMYNEHARDFALLHYKLNGRRGEAFWEQCRTMSLPDSLEYRRSLYESRGRIVQYDAEPLDDMAWINLFDEHGVRPRSNTPVADGVELAQLENHVTRVRQVMVKELGTMPTYAEYLSKLQRND